MFTKNFLFGRGFKKRGAVSVSETDLYGIDSDYGFVTERCRKEQSELRVPELNSGFDTVYWYRNEEITVIKEEESSCYIEKDNAYAREARQIPLCFKTVVPRQGNYKVTVSLCPGTNMRNILVFSGRRRLIFKKDFLEKGQLIKITAMVNVCDIVPRGKTRIYEDKTIDITVLADRPCISGVYIEEETCPTFYIAGDSTVTDQSADYPYAPETSYSGWGQMITAFLDDGIGVSNHSHSGLTTERFKKEGHYAVVDQYSKPRDYFLFQFGHNDQKLEELKAGFGYRNNLAGYINECREKGIFPLIITPMARNSWKGNDGSYNDLLEQYADACKELGKEMRVPVLDLHQRSMEFIRGLGLENAKRYFYPNDFTHSNDYGAYYMARLVAEEIVRVCGRHESADYRLLAEHVTKGFGDWIPPENICLPEKPGGYEDMENPEQETEWEKEFENPEGDLIRADALNLVIKMARFFPTNVYNDLFEDVIGHEWYAGTVECAVQNGIILPQLCPEGRFYPEQRVTLKEFLAFAMNGYRSRRNFPTEKPCCYDVQTEEYLQPFVRAAFALGVIAGDGSEDMNAVIKRKQAVEICKRLHI